MNPRILGLGPVGLRIPSTSPLVFAGYKPAGVPTSLSGGSMWRSRRVFTKRYQVQWWQHYEKHIIYIIYM